APHRGATLRTQDGRGIITCRVMRVHFGVRMAEMHHEHSDTLVFAPGYCAVYADQRARAAFAFLRDYQTLAEL
ncbi:MAG: hypothetical protein ACREXS_14380, partial [Gammaproteobacteria bacterium]